MANVNHDTHDHTGVTGVPAAGLSGVRGRVNANGTEAADTGGFTSVKDSTGAYTVTFGTPFAAMPAVMLQAHDTSGARHSFITAISTSAFSVLCSDFAGNSADAVFSFIAIGY